MSGIEIPADTNIIIYYFGGNEKIEKFLLNKLIYISAITYAELLSKPVSSGEELFLRDYVNSVQIVHTNNFICEVAADLRKAYKIKLPDAIIAATCFFLNIPSLTFDENFSKN